MSTISNESSTSKNDAVFLRLHKFLRRHVPELKSIRGPLYEMINGQHILWFKVAVPSTYKLTRKDNDAIAGLLHDDDKPFRRGEGFLNRVEEKIARLLSWDVGLGHRDYELEHEYIDDDGLVFELGVILEPAVLVEISHFHIEEKYE